LAIGQSLILVNEHRCTPMNTDRLSLCTVFIGVLYGSLWARLRFQKQDFCHSSNSY